MPTKTRIFSVSSLIDLLYMILPGRLGYITLLATGLSEENLWIQLWVLLPWLATTLGEGKLWIQILSQGHEDSSISFNFVLATPARMPVPGCRCQAVSAFVFPLDNIDDIEREETYCMGNCRCII